MGLMFASTSTALGAVGRGSSVRIKLSSGAVVFGDVVAETSKGFIVLNGDKSILVLFTEIAGIDELFINTVSYTRVQRETHRRNQTHWSVTAIYCIFVKKSASGTHPRTPQYEPPSTSPKSHLPLLHRGTTSLSGQPHTALDLHVVAEQ